MEIPRNPEVPFLNDEAIALLEGVCFRENTICCADVETLFVFGSTSALPAMIQEITNLVSEARITSIVVTGGIKASTEKTQRQSEADMIADSLRDILPEDIRIHRETRSTNTLENVRNAACLYDIARCGSLCFISKYHAAGRSFLTLKKFFPDVPLKQRAFVANGCAPATWSQSESARQIVWGEFLRIRRYGSRGDIVTDLVGDPVERIALIARHDSRTS